MRSARSAVGMVAVVAVVGACIGQGATARAGERVASRDLLRTGRALFERVWIPEDRRSHGGDGLGPVFNDRSCVACHNQGGTGGAGSARKNVDIVTAVVTRTQSSRCPTNASPAGLANEPKTTDRAPLVAIHPGFATAGSVVLHRFGASPSYALWRQHVMLSDPPASQPAAKSKRRENSPEPAPDAELPARAQRGTFTLLRSQRNPTPLFGAGLIDAIPDSVLRQAAATRYAAFPEIQGRVSRLKDGRIGRFGWKAQTATLSDFVLTACAVELGLEVPGHHQAGDPLGYGDRVTGLDLSGAECDALIAYIGSLPAPVRRTGRSSDDGRRLFERIGCAACHTPKLGDVEGLYSDLLLHDMGEELQDTGGYGAFTPQSPGDELGGPEGPLAAGASFVGPPVPTVATRVEWRTPPLWGVCDSAPYLHDGRAATLDQAIRLHGGEAALSAQRYQKLSRPEQLHIRRFLSALVAPPPDRERNRHDRRNALVAITRGLR